MFFPNVYHYIIQSISRLLSREDDTKTAYHLSYELRLFQSTRH